MIQRIREENYRIYLTDCLFGLCAAWDNPPTRRYYDILHPNSDAAKTDRETAVERLERFGIKVVDR